MSEAVIAQSMVNGCAGYKFEFPDIRLATSFCIGYRQAAFQFSNDYTEVVIEIMPVSKRRQAHLLENHVPQADIDYLVAMGDGK